MASEPTTGEARRRQGWRPGLTLKLAAPGIVGLVVVLAGVWTLDRKTREELEAVEARNVDVRERVLRSAQSSSEALLNLTVLNVIAVTSTLARHVESLLKDRPALKTALERAEDLDDSDELHKLLNTQQIGRSGDLSLIDADKDLIVWHLLHPPGTKIAQATPRLEELLVKRGYRDRATRARSGQLLAPISSGLAQTRYFELETFEEKQGSENVKSVLFVTPLDGTRLSLVALVRSGLFQQLEANIHDNLDQVGKKVQISSDQLRVAQARFRRGIAILSLVALLVLAATLYTGYRYLVMPVRALTTVADQIRRGEARVRAQLGSKDEIETLGKTFNKMLDELARRRGEVQEQSERLAALAASLDQKVNDRTGELEQALKRSQTLQSQLLQAEKMSSLGQLVAGISHELRTPAQAIVSQAQNLEKVVARLGDAGSRPEQQQRMREHLESIPRDLVLASKQLAAVVSGLRRFSRQDESVMAQVDLHGSIEETLLIARNATKQHEIVRDFDPTIRPVECFPSQLNQVVLNLVVNAAQAMKGAGVITLRTRNLDDLVEIAVQDNGPGIPPDVLPRIFEPFYTTKPVGEGTGLGLAICHTIVSELHHGTLSVASEPGVGTTFTIVIPTRQEKHPERPPAGAEAHADHRAV